MYGVVYFHTNQSNGKVYVGQTRLPKRRKNAHFRERSYFSRALQKYGWDGFDHFYLDVANQEEMDNLEKLWIWAFQTTDRNLGYNIQSGGKLYGSHSDETRKKIAEKAKNRIVSLETCRKISQAHLGNSYAKGFKHSEETRRKVSLAGKGRKFTPEHRAKLSAALIGNKRGCKKESQNGCT